MESTHKTTYEKNKPKLLNDNSICKENRKWFKTFFDYQEKKLKRSNGLRELDEPTYKTLNGYINRLRNVNNWFKNQDLKGMSKKKFEKELTQVYDDLEDGIILNKCGKPFGDTDSYYSKIFKSYPFELIGKKEVAIKVIQYSKKKNKEAKFFLMDNWDVVRDTPVELRDRCLLQVLRDYGENVGAVLQTRKGEHFKRVINEEGEPEYHFHMNKEILKRSRTPRTEINNFDKTRELLDAVLENVKDGDLIFPIGLRRAEQLFDRVVKKTNLKNVDGSKPSLKDIRSSMSCDLLDKNWTSDEIKSRLGHSPSSDVLDVYVNYKALNKKKAKKKIEQTHLADLKRELEKSKERERLKDLRLSEMQEDMKFIKEILKKKGVLK